MGTASKNASEAFDMSWEIAELKKQLADTHIQLAEARRDAERMLSALKGLFRDEPLIYEGRLEGSLYAKVDAIEEARSIIDAARAAEEKTT